MLKQKEKLLTLLDNADISGFFEECQKQGLKGFELNRLRQTFIIKGSSDVDFISQCKTLVNFYPLPTPKYWITLIVLIVLIIIAYLLIISANVTNSEKELALLGKKSKNTTIKKDSVENLDIEEDMDSIVNIQLAVEGAFGDDCDNPIVIPNSIINGKQGKKRTSPEDTVDCFRYIRINKKKFRNAVKNNWTGYISAKLPRLKIKNEEFYLPFYVTVDETKKNIIISNKFLVRISVENAPEFVNAISDCGGEGHFYKAKNQIILSNRKKSYSQSVEFPQADSYILKNGELNAFEIHFKIEDPAIYHIVVEIPYNSNGKRRIIKLKAPDIVAPLSYHSWSSLCSSDDFSYVLLCRHATIHKWNPNSKKYKWEFEGKCTEETFGTSLEDVQ